MGALPQKTRFFGQFLLSNGLVDERSLAEATHRQAAINLPLGALALGKGLLSERQVLKIHTEQKRTDRRFGEIAVDLGFLTRGQLDLLLSEQKATHSLLGEVLVDMGALQREALDRALKTYEKEQAAAEEAAKTALAKAPRADVVQIAADLTGRMLLRMGRLQAKVGRVVPGGQLPALGRIFSQRVSGGLPFGYLLALDDAVALGLARSMLEAVQGKDDLPTTLDALALDAGKELVNIIVGQMCGRLAGTGARGLEPAPPEVETTIPATEPGMLRVVVELSLPFGPAAFALDVGS
jgi:hypothetical protein